MPEPLSWISMESRPWFLKRTSVGVSWDAYRRGVNCTDGGGAGVDAVFDQLLDDGAEVDNDLAGLYLMDLYRVSRDIRMGG